MWHEIHNEKELQGFLDQMWHFHDSCIKEIRYLSGAYVNSEGWMHPLNDKRVLSVILQGNFQNAYVIEMEFSELEYLRLWPIDPTYTCEIFEAFMTWKNGNIYWYDREGLLENDADKEGTVICAKHFRWRAVEGCSSPEDFYKAAK